MKKFFLIASIIVVVCQAKAQETHNYFNKTIEHRDTSGKTMSWARTDPAKGKISIDSNFIVLSPVGTSSKFLMIVRRGAWEPYDEGYYLREFSVVELTGPKSMRAFSVLVLRNAKKQVSDITLKFNDGNITYQILPYKPGEYGYKLQHHLKTD